jgi:hypothetical protein
MSVSFFKLTLGASADLSTVKLSDVAADTLPATSTWRTNKLTEPSGTEGMLSSQDWPTSKLY